MTSSSSGGEENVERKHYWYTNILYLTVVKVRGEHKTNIQLRISHLLLFNSRVTSDTSHLVVYKNSVQRTPL